MDASLVNKIIDEIVSRHNNVYDCVYFYGQRLAISSLLDLLTEKYSKHRPLATIIRTDAWQFFEETRRDPMDRWVCSLDCDLFIFENMDAIAGKQISEQRLFGILDWFLENKRQIVLTGNVPPAELDLLAPRIRAQIDGGITCCAE